MKRSILATGLLAVWATFSVSSAWAGDLPIHQPYANDKHPTVAHNTSTNEYLSVLDSGGTITAVKLDSTGRRQGATVIGSYSSSLYGPVEPAVAYNRTRNEYLVVWRNPSIDSTVKGRRLNANGDALGNEFIVMDSGGSSPSVAYSPSSGQYLVAASTAGGIAGKLVRWDGVRGNYIWLTGFQHYYAQEADVAYNSAANEFFVVWQDKYYGSGSDFDIIGQRVSTNGSLLGGHIGVAMAGSKSRRNPDIVYNPTYDEYAVAYEYDWSASDHDVKVQRLSRYGTRRGGETTIAAQTNWEGEPSISHNSTANEYLIAYQYAYSGADHDIKLQRMANYGVRIGSPNAVAVSGKWEGEADVVYNPLRNEYLAVFEYEWSANDHDIRGQRLSAQGYRL